MSPSTRFSGRQRFRYCRVPALSSSFKWLLQSQSSAAVPIRRAFYPSGTAPQYQLGVQYCIQAPIDLPLQQSLKPAKHSLGRSLDRFENYTFIRDWSELLSLPVSEIRYRLSRRDEQMTRLRLSSPFMLASILKMISCGGASGGRQSELSSDQQPANVPSG